MKRLPIVLSLLVIAGCKEDERMMEVGFFAQCRSCVIEYGIVGETLQRDTIGGAAVKLSMPATVGQQAVITGTPLMASDTATGVAILLNGFQRWFIYELPPATAHLSVPVVALNRYGEEE